MAQQIDFPAYSIALYGGEKVEESCLRLQDEYGLDVNAVLFCYWFGARHGVIGEDLWRRIDEISHQWQGRLVRPLRDARRWLKNPEFALDREMRDLRERIKENELAAEIMQQRMMREACGSGAGGAPGEPAAATRCNVDALLLRGGVEVDSEIEGLLAAISKAAFG